ncbi:MAG: DUF481 domain-containing protein [Gemmatimonadaceae bacterium]|jgi:putative salt-induced outer membrane protein|nr:DUF481 domain-containing protein [Gemmatimonadaceae bacterium]
MRLVRRLAASLLVASPLAAQQPAAGPSAPAKPPYEFAADFSLASAQGNQDVLTTALGEKFVYKWPRWAFTQVANIAYGRANGVTNAQLYTFGVRTDYTLRPRLTLYARVDALSNEPAGLRAVLNEAAGASWTLVKDANTEMRLDLGLGALQRRFVAAGGVVQPGQNDFVGNVDGYFKQTFSPRAYFEQTVGFVPNLTTSAGWLGTAKSSLVAPLTARLGLKLGYLATFNNAPSILPVRLPDRPAPVRAKKFDGLLTAGVQFTM